jgi:hypothetical protein
MYLVNYGTKDKPHWRKVIHILKNGNSEWKYARKNK